MFYLKHRNSMRESSRKVRARARARRRRGSRSRRNILFLTLTAIGQQDGELRGEECSTAMPSSRFWPWKVGAFPPLVLREFGLCAIHMLTWCDTLEHHGNT